MPVPVELAPGVPTDYYQAIAGAEEAHWWHRGMRAISAALLGPRLAAGGRVLDAGCGTGGFLRFLVDSGGFTFAAGADIASAAIALARERIPEADLRVAPLNRLPYADASFDVVVCNDVLQHVPENDVAASLGEMRRVLAREGVLLLRTNGCRQLRRERADWRAYDRASLVAALVDAGLVCERVTYSNLLLSLWAAARGGGPKPPTEERHGIPQVDESAWKSALALRTLRFEARWLAHSQRTLPYGHTLFAVAGTS